MPATCEWSATRVLLPRVPWPRRFEYLKGKYPGHALVFVPGDRGYCWAEALSLLKVGDDARKVAGRVQRSLAKHSGKWVTTLSPWIETEARCTRASYPRALLWPGVGARVAPLGSRLVLSTVRA